MSFSTAKPKEILSKFVPVTARMEDVLTQAPFCALYHTPTRTQLRMQGKLRADRISVA